VGSTARYAPTMGAQPDPRDDSQQARERAMTEVSDVLIRVPERLVRGPVTSGVIVV
jgi:hypothetical protein